MTPRSPLLEAVAKVAYWIMLAASLWILLRGHNAPGGGFIGGLVAVAATSLVCIVYGVDDARRRLPLDPMKLAVTGILLALGSGLIGMFAGGSFLTHQWWTVDIAGADIKLSTVLVFDVGVYAAVWGAFASYLFELLNDPEAEA